jgi:3-methyladenine DNA glycosylase AlkD
MSIPEIIEQLRSLGSPENVAGMARYGIVAKEAFGVTAPNLKALARDLKKQTGDRHSLALQLWETGIHDARALAYLIDDPKKVTDEQMESWVRDFDNWAICDSTCGHLFSRTPHAYDKIPKWCESDDEFVKRAGIALIAWLTVHDKKADDATFSDFLPLLERHSDDDRNLIKKAVNWALRQIGKRNLHLNKLAIQCAERIKQQGSKPARWIATDAIRELTNEKLLARLNK